MDAEILQTLQEIRGTLFVIAGICVAGLAVWIIRGTAQIAVNLHDVVFARWKNSAYTMFAKKQYAKLIEHCSYRLKELPNDEWALWWSARANRELGNHDLSQQQFRQIIQLTPNWKKAVEPYLNEGTHNDVPQ